MDRGEWRGKSGCSCLRGFPIKVFGEKKPHSLKLVESQAVEAEGKLRE